MSNTQNAPKTTNAMNITAEHLEAELKELSTLVTNLKRATVAVTSIASSREELAKKRDELSTKLQAALDSGDLDTMSKHTAELKRVKARLEENPVEKVQAFDEAVDALAKFTSKRSA